jgi:hypothetical protein
MGLMFGVQVQAFNRLQTAGQAFFTAGVFCGDVHGFKGSGVQGSILVAGLHLGCAFTRKASVSPGPIQNLEPTWQLVGKISIFNEDFGSLMPSLSLTLNAEPPGPDLTLRCSII